MSHKAETLKYSPFVQIKDGDGSPPIFIAHGLCGTVQFYKLAKHIRTGNPVYGIQAKGIDGTEQPFDRVEDMGRFYLESLKHRHPEGPYILVGYSFGGLIALDMAQHLFESGKEVALLVLVDTYPHPRYLAAAQRRLLFVRRMKRHFSEMRRLPLSSAFAYFLRRFKNRLRLTESLPEGQSKGLDLSPSKSALKRVETKSYQAYTLYQPKFYPGNIKFVQAKGQSFFPDDPVEIWGHLAAELEIEVIPGDHHSVVKTEFEPLAAAITRYVQELECVEQS